MRRRTKLAWPKPKYSFEVPIYGGQLYVLTSRAAFRQALEFLKVPDEDDLPTKLGVARSMTNKTTGSRLFLVGWFDGSLLTLTHEMTHISLFVLDLVGIDARRDAGEALCYLQTALLKRCGVK